MLLEEIHRVHADFGYYGAPTVHRALLAPRPSRRPASGRAADADSTASAPVEESRSPDHARPRPPAVPRSPTSSNVTSMPTSPTRSGSPTSPRCAPAKAGSTSRSSSTPSTANLSLGHRRTRHPQDRDSSARRGHQDPSTTAGLHHPLRPRLPVHRRKLDRAGQPSPATSLLRCAPQLLRQRCHGVLVRIIQMRRALPQAVNPPPVPKHEPASSTTSGPTTLTGSTPHSATCHPGPTLHNQVPVRENGARPVRTRRRGVRTPLRHTLCVGVLSPTVGTR